MHNYKATTIERFISEIRYIRRYSMGDIIAGIATAGILVLAPILMAFGR